METIAPGTLDCSMLVCHAAHLAKCRLPGSLPTCVLSTSSVCLCHAGKFLSTALKEADTDQDGRINLPDFIKYYERLAR